MRSWLVACVVLVASSAGAEPVKLRPFGTFDWYTPGNAGKGLEDDAQAAANQLSGTGYTVTGTVETKGAPGFRAGVVGELSPSFDLGASAGIILGANSEATLNATAPGLAATLRDDRTVRLFRVLLEPSLKTKMSERTAFHLAAGIGVAHGRVEDEYNCSGNACLISRQSYSSTWSGFTWEISPYIVADKGLFGIRYAGMPKFGGNDNQSKIDWQTLVLFAGLKF